MRYIVIFILSFLFVSLAKRNNDQLAEIKKLENNITVLTEEMDRYKTDKEETVTAVKALIVRSENLEEYNKALQETVEALKCARNAEVASAVVYNTVIRDSIIWRVDTLRQTDTCLEARDKFTHFNLCRTADSVRLDYRVKDSVSLVLRKMYKRKFLWWKWGVKGYECDIINQNPNVVIDHAKYIQAEN
jgi:hypothetical protein